MQRLVLMQRFNKRVKPPNRQSKNVTRNMIKEQITAERSHKTSDFDRVYLRFAICAVMMLVASSSLASTTSMQAGNPLVFKTEIRKDKDCTQPCLVVEASLTNTSSEAIAIDTVGLQYLIEIRKFTSLPNGGSEEMMSKLGDYGPDQYNENTYRVLKAGDTYRTTINLPLTDKFFQRKGAYEIKFTYGQFRDYSFDGVKLFKGTIESSQLEFNCNSRRTRTSRRICG